VGETKIFSMSPILERIVVKVCVLRLALLVLILVPVSLAWLELIQPVNYFVHSRQELLTTFLVFGFGLNVLFLVTWKYFTSLRFFFLLQLASDIFLASFLLLLTGGIKSGFGFLFLVIIFLYGRTLGQKVALYASLLIGLFFICLTLTQYVYPKFWGQDIYEPSELTYNLFLHFLAIILVNVLVRLGKDQEEDLILKLLQQEIALGHAESLKKQVFDWMLSGLLVLNEKGHISALNKKAQEFLGVKDVKLALKRPLKELSPELFLYWHENRDRRPKLRETQLKDGRILGIRVTSVPDENLYLVIFRDITEYRQLERRVQQMEKLASVGELAAGLVHEMKNPLAGIKTSLQLLVQKNLEKEYADRLTQVILRDIDRLDNLLKDFLVFARPRQGHQENVKLGEVVEECIHVLQNQYPHVSIEVNENLDQATWEWDRNQLHQVILNLLLNALQAVQDNPAPKVMIYWERKGNEERLVIKDNGPGINHDLKQKVFDPFFTTKKEGTGLGLAIAQRLAGLNGAFIELEAGESGGTKACLVRNFRSSLINHQALNQCR